MRRWPRDEAGADRLIMRGIAVIVVAVMMPFITLLLREFNPLSDHFNHFTRLTYFLQRTALSHHQSLEFIPII